jgi:hypothetical protein
MNHQVRHHATNFDAVQALSIDLAAARTDLPRKAQLPETFFAQAGTGTLNSIAITSTFTGASSVAIAKGIDT